MTLSKPDIRRLRGSLSGLLLVLCAGGAAIASSEIMLVRSQRELNDVQQQLNRAHKQLASTEEDSANMNTYQLEYGDLLARNIIGSDQRLDWIEGMEAIRKLSPVRSFSYAIAAQQSSAPMGDGNLAADFSGMTLHFDLLHEGQLLDFFDAMHNTIRGRFLIHRCMLKRSAAPSASMEAPGSAGQLEADCDGNWMVLTKQGEQ